MKVETQIGFRSQEYTESYSIHTIQIHLSDQDIEEVSKAKDLLRSNRRIDHIALKIEGAVFLLDDCGEEVTDWVPMLHYLLVKPYGVLYHAEEKRFSGDYIESECLEIPSKK